MAAELRELARPGPEWPGGRETLWLEPTAAVPEEGRIVAFIPTVARAVGETELDRLPGLRILANYGVGVDNIDLGAAAARALTVTNTPDVLTDATADLAVALLLAAARRLREGLALAAGGSWEGWHPTQLLGLGLRGRTLAILGAGRIGRAVARRAVAFGMRIRYWSRSPAPDLEAEAGAERAATLEEALRGADAVSVHLPLTAETRGLIGERELGLLAEGAVLVNTARGGIVDAGALEEAVRAGRISAGLDVFDDEPQIPQGLRASPNAFVLPHLGSATREARLAMWRVAADNVRRVLGGEPPATPVGQRSSGRHAQGPD